MKKSDLRSGMVIRYRDGDFGLVVDFYGELVSIGRCFWGTFYAYNEDLTYADNPDCDIVEIYDGEKGCFDLIIDSAKESKPIWKRSERSNHERSL